MIGLDAIKAALAPYRLAIECGALVVLTLAFVGAWTHHNNVERAIGAQKILDADRRAAETQARAVAAQEKKDAQKLADAHRDHETEIAGLAAQYAADLAHRNPPSVVCRATTAPDSGAVRSAPGLPARENGPTGDGGGGGAMPDRDIYPALRLLALRLDTLNADARELERATH